MISEAFAGHGVVSTGSSGGGDALLIILGVAVAAGFLYALQKRLRRRLSGDSNRDEDDLQNP